MCVYMCVRVRVRSALRHYIIYARRIASQLGVRASASRHLNLLANPPISHFIVAVHTYSVRLQSTAAATPSAAVVPPPPPKRK